MKFQKSILFFAVSVIAIPTWAMPGHELNNVFPLSQSPSKFENKTSVFSKLFGMFALSSLFTHSNGQSQLAANHDLVHSTFDLGSVNGSVTSMPLSIHIFSLPHPLELRTLISFSQNYNSNSIQIRSLSENSIQLIYKILTVSNKSALRYFTRNDFLGSLAVERGVDAVKRRVQLIHLSMTPALEQWIKFENDILAYSKSESCTLCDRLVFGCQHKEASATQADFSHLDSHGRPYLHWLVRLGSDETLAQALNVLSREQILAKDLDGNNVFHVASLYGKGGMASLILNHLKWGNDGIFTENNAGLTPYRMAIGLHSTSAQAAYLGHLLQDFQAAEISLADQSFATDFAGNGIAYFAASLGDVNLLKQLVSDVNKAYENDYPASHIIRLLAGSSQVTNDYDHGRSYWVTPAYAALKFNHLETFTFILDQLFNEISVSEDEHDLRQNVLHPYNLYGKTLVTLAADHPNPGYIQVLRHYFPDYR